MFLLELFLNWLNIYINSSPVFNVPVLVGTMVTFQSLNRHEKGKKAIYPPFRYNKSDIMSGLFSLYGI